jgi:glycosyltransferase domain-containing protein
MGAHGHHSVSVTHRRDAHALGVAADSVTDIADDLTIVLTLKDRAAYTLRWMSYANRVAMPFKVLVADGGADESVPSMFSDKSRFPNVRYEYVRYPYDASYSIYYAKLANALAHVRTPYVALADNDDFFIVDALSKSVEFLAANPDYVACGGQCAAFWISATGNKDPQGLLYGGDIEWKYISNPATESPLSARERIRHQCLGVNDIWYNVIRTGERRRQFEALKNFGPNDLFFAEHLVSFLSAIAGRIRQLDTLYMVRQQNAPHSSGGAHQETFGDWWGRMLVPTWSADFTRFVDITAAQLSAADGTPVDEARSWIVKSYRLWVAPSLLSNILDEESITPTTPLTAQLVRAIVRLPEESWLKRSIRWCYRKSRWLSFESVYGTAIIASPASNARRQFEPVREFLRGGQSSTFTSGT